MYYVNVAVEHKSRHTDELYTYASEAPLAVGQMVSVTFGKGTGEKRAFVFETDVQPGIEPSRIKQITGVLSEYALTEENIRTISWMRQRYGIRYIDGIHCFTPPGKPPRPGKEKRPLSKISEEAQEITDLTDEQEAALSAIGSAIEQKKNRSFLIHGVTGSGKTEVYMQAAARALASGRGVIMLVPEIALTKQILERFAGRFGKENLAVMHSRLTARERYDEWMRIYRGEAKIVIGARIGVFAPLRDIGLIILDEEHEATYKSDQTPKYETVDIAAKRLLSTGGVMVLGSATPSVVSYQRAKEGIYDLLVMNRRYNEVPLPKIEMVDMREELRMGNRSIFSSYLFRSIRQTVAAGSQAILFLNRRGYSTVLSCKECGNTLKCPECGISLVYHKAEDAAVCHYCGKHFPIPDRCPECGSPEIRRLGAGTEKVEELTRELFPDLTVDRLDLDTARKTGEINRILGSFSKGKTDILIGTQLVAKGLDFRNVGLVGVISADVSLNIPDYRSTERTFQLVTQVAGRAGRGDMQGKVIVQTSTPDNFALIAAAQHDYKSFFAQEVMLRQFMKYPPFTDIIIADLTADDEQTAQEQAENCRQYLIRAGLPESDKIYPPQITSSFKGTESSRYHIMIKCPKGMRNQYVYYLRYFGEQLTKNRTGCNLIIDVNPYSTY
ncbi:MAG: primosomal protein N' [Eubacterium sp.]|nr:primosomal protein N' [Eubacterium sp.]